MENKKFYVYIIECENGSYYTGYTTDLDKRFRSHENGKAGAKYTRSFKPVRIACSWILKNKSDALKAEIFIKSLNRKKKDELIADPKLLKHLLLDKKGYDIL